MIKHALDIIKDAVAFLNPGQVPVVAFDQPLYAIAKQLQWHYRDQYGINKFVIMMGALHIEMAFLSTLGDWVEDSGWTTLINNAKVARAGVAQSLLTGHDVARTKYSHEVTLCALYKLLHNAFNHFNAENVDACRFDEWCNMNELKNPQFQYWLITLRMECNLLLFLRSIRSGNFQLYKYALDKMLP